MQRQVVDVFGDDDVREEALGGERFLDRLWRRWRFDDAGVTVRAGVFGACRFDDDEAGRLVFQFLRDGVADPRFRVSAAADLVGVRDVDLDAVPREMRGEWPPPRRPPPLVPAHRRLPRIHLDGLRHGPGSLASCSRASCN